MGWLTFFSRKSNGGKRRYSKKLIVAADCYGHIESGVKPWVVGQVSSEAAICAATSNILYGRSAIGEAYLTLSEITGEKREDYDTF